MGRMEERLPRKRGISCEVWTATEAPLRAGQSTCGEHMMAA